MFLARLESFNVQVKEIKLLQSPSYAGKDTNKSSYFGEFLQFQDENDRLR